MQKVIIRHTVHKESFRTIAKSVQHLSGRTLHFTAPSINRTIRHGPHVDNYKNCGRHAKITPELQKWLVSRLKVLRRTIVCTSQTLQWELAKVKGGLRV